jgi:hypothetical protein
VPPFVPANPTKNANQQIPPSNLPPLSTSPYLSIETPYWVGDLGTGETKTATLKIYLPHEKLTQQPLPITMDYEAGGKHQSETHLIGVQINGAPAFQIRNVMVVPTLTFPGDVGTRMDVNIVNSGFGIANNVTAELVLPPGLTPAWGNANQMYFGRILPNQNITASFFVNVDAGLHSANYPVTVILKHADGTNVLHSDFFVAPKSSFSLVNVLNTDKLYPGATNVPLQVFLRNTGSATAQTITTKLLGGNTIPGVKSTIQTSVGNTEDVGDILPNQVFPTTFIVNLDPQTTTAGTQSASIQVTWTQSDTAGVPLKNVFVQTIPITYHVEQGPSYLYYYNGIPLTYLAIAAIITGIVVIFMIQRKKKVDKVDLYLQRQASSRTRSTSENIDSSGGGRRPPTSND